MYPASYMELQLPTINLHARQNQFLFSHNRRLWPQPEECPIAWRKDRVWACWKVECTTSLEALHVCSF